MKSFKDSFRTETSFSKATMVMRFPAKKNVGCPNASRDFIPRKNGILHPPSSCHGAPLPLPQSLYGRTGSYADVITKLSRINRLPDLFTRGAPRAPLSTAELILTTFLSFSDSYIGGLREARKPQNRTEKRKKTTLGDRGFSCAVSGCKYALRVVHSIYQSRPQSPRAFTISGIEMPRALG